MGYFGRVTVSLHILYIADQETEGSQDRLTVSFFNSALRASVTLRAMCHAPARIWLAVIDLQNGEQQSRSGSDKKRKVGYSRLIKVPLG